jgi:transposase InsO family protein
MARKLEVSRSGFYTWFKRPLSLRAREDKRLGARAAAIHHEHKGRYGTPRVHKQLHAEGEHISCKRVDRLLSEQGLRAKPKKRFKKTTDSNHNNPIAPNLLDRRFQATAPNQKWVGDITYLHTAEGWLYLAVLLDLYSRKVVGWAMSENVDANLAIAAFEMAVTTRGASNKLLHHTDRGSTYTAHDYRKKLIAYHVQPSMSRKGNCWDNAVSESFFGTLEKELCSDTTFQSRERARAEVFAYIEGYYNERRIHSAIGYVTPNQKERAFLTAQALAA